MKLGLFRNWEPVVIKPREKVCSLSRGGHECPEVMAEPKRADVCTQDPLCSQAVSRPSGVSSLSVFTLPFSSLSCEN